MNKIKITVVALATAGVGLVGVNTAFAGTAHITPKAPAVAPATDGDNVQERDQSTPDVPGAVEAPEATSSKVAAQSTSTSVKAAAAKSAAAETPGTETPDGTEAGVSETGASDGNDGGHADPEGVDVNHEGGAGEK
jgi:hypothetical protein